MRSVPLGLQRLHLWRQAVLMLVWAWGGWMGGRNTVEAAVPAVSDEYLLRGWDMDEGLPQNAITDIVQTPDGYLWMGTRDGLVRFDGVRFKVFRSFDGTNRFAPEVRCLTLAADGSLWAGFARMAVVRERGGEFELMAPPQQYSERILALSANRAGEVWAGYSQGRLGHWHSGRWETMVLSATNEATRLRDDVTCCTDVEQRIWFASEWLVGYLEGGVAVMLRQNNQEFFHLTPRRKGGVWLTNGRTLRIATTNGIGEVVADLSQLGIGFSGDIQTLMEDRQGAVWFGTKDKGLFRYFDGKAERVPTSHNYIQALYEDYEGNLWVGTAGGGLNRLRARTLRLYDRSNVLPKDLILSLCEDREGSLWLLSRQSMPVQLARNRQGIVPHTNEWEGLLSGVSLCADHSGGVWLGSFDRGLFHLEGNRCEPNGLKNEQINSVFEDSQGTLWVGTIHHGLISVRDGIITRFPTTNNLQQITALAEDPGGGLWVGTYGGTLHQRVKDGFVSFGAEAGMPGPSILSLYAEGSGRVWIGARGSGLLLFREGKVQKITQAQGLADDEVRQILPDGQGNLWIGSARGLFRVSEGEVEAVMDGKAAHCECVVYGRNEGLGSIEFSEGFRNAACRTRDGKLWFATSRGAVEVTPKGQMFRLTPPPVCVEELLVDGRPVPKTRGQPVTIPAGSRSVDLRYTALSFAAPENVLFRHRLEAVESEWLEAGTERSASYLRLPPGHYRFCVTARSGGGVWQPEPATLDFVVLPTLWQNLYVRLLLAGLLLGLAALLTRAILLRRMRARLLVLQQAQALDNERRRIARDMHDELGASLTRIALMGQQTLRKPGLEGEVTLQVKRIIEASREVVQTLDQIVWAVNPGNDRLDRVIDYLSRYADEFLASTNIQFRQELPESVPPTGMTSHVRHQLLLAVKEALNNAVKHSEATEITLNITLEPQMLHINLSDNGHGFDPAEKAAAGDGLHNLSQRLSGIGGQCRTESTVGGGAVVRMTLPLRNGNAL